MERYLETPGLEPSVSFDTSQFADVELTGTLMQFKEAKEDFWFNIGIGGSIIAAPIIYKDTIYVGVCDKNFYALTLDGKEKWRFRVKSIIPTYATPHDGVLYVGSFDHNIYAITEEGKLLWTFHAKDIVPASPTYHEGVLYAGSSDGNMYAIDAKTGQEIWRFHTQGKQTQPRVHENRLYFGHGDNTFYCLDLNGSLIWKYRTNGLLAAWEIPFGNGKVYFGNWDKNIYCLDAETGRLKWKFHAQEATRAPFLWNNRLYFGCEDNKAYCIDAQTGRLLWTFKTKGFTADSSLVVDGRYYVPCFDNNLYVLDAMTGKLLWKFQTQGMVTKVAVYGNRVLFGSWDCHLYCTDLQGRLLWKFQTSMGSPSKIAPPETSFVKTAQLTIPQETTEEKKDKYQMQTLGADSESSYKIKSDYIVKHQYTKRKKVKSMSSGWED